MTDEITNIVLLEHIQAMKNDLQQQIASLDQKIDRRTGNLEEKMKNGFSDVQREFEQVHQELREAREHRQALQEDLEATIRMVAKHEKKLIKIS